jgi:uncharacterized protein YbjT (DUF2867 family)
MRALVTGGSGFLGAYVVQELHRRGHEVAALARSTAAADKIYSLGAEPVLGDLDDPASIGEAFTAASADALVNVASLGFGHAPTIVAAAENAGIQRAVFVSTTAIFTNLNAPSKRIRTAAEELIRASALDWTIIRPTMIYGDPGDRNLARLLRLVRRSPVVPLPGGGRRLQQPVHVADLAAAVVSAVERPVAVGREYDVAGPEPLSFRELVQESARAVGRRPRLIAVPLRPAIACARAYEQLAPRPRIKAEQLERLAEDKEFDIADARRDLDFSPRSFRQGIQQEAATLG